MPFHGFCRGFLGNCHVFSSRMKQILVILLLLPGVISVSNDAADVGRDDGGSCWDPYAVWHKTRQVW